MRYLLSIRLFRAVAVVIIICLLASCGGGGNESNAASEFVYILFCAMFPWSCVGDGPAGDGGAGDPGAAGNTPPTISYVYPANGSRWVSTDSTIRATFSEAIDSQTVTIASFLVSGPSGSISGNVHTSDSTVTFTPGINLPDQSIITVTITTAVKDLSGNALASNYPWTFTTAAQDNTPPTVSATFPTDNATDVAVNAVITATFSETMMASTVNTATFNLDNGVPSTVTYSGTKATFTPSSNLAYSTTYTAAITTGVTDSAGNAMAATYTWTFTTSSTTGILKLPDTGQKSCYDASGAIVSCGGTGPYLAYGGQDGAYTINPPSYADNGDGTITDNVTSLVWQKQDAALVRTWDDATAYCSNLTLAGQTGWRLPSRIELASIVDYGVFKPAINAAFFPSTSSLSYWSSTTYAYNTSRAWVVQFDYGRLSDNDKTSAGYVRCVRGGQISQNLELGPDAAYPSYATVTDSVTHLMWQQNNSDYMTWGDALAYCEGLSLAGKSDWRLPNIKELSSIVDDTRYGLAINEEMFPDTRDLNYWSSTTANDDTSLALTISFFYGKTSYYFKSPPGGHFRSNFRCVRGGK